MTQPSNEMNTDMDMWKDPAVIEAFNEASEVLRAVSDEIGQVWRAPDAVRIGTVAALAAGGHVLLEAHPGTGKTMFAKAYGKATGLKWARTQGADGTRPSTLVGYVDPRTNEYVPGVLASNDFILADEFNRNDEDLQGAYLEAAGEKQVSVAGETHKLDYFSLLATQNSKDRSEGTYPLNDANRSRFLASFELEAPNHDARIGVVRDAYKRGVEQFGKGDQAHELDRLKQVTTKAGLITVKSHIHSVLVSDTQIGVIVGIDEILSEYENKGELTYVDGHRPAQNVLRLAQGLAMIRGARSVNEEDLETAATAAHLHLVQPTMKSKYTARDYIDDAIKTAKAAQENLSI